MKWSEVKVGATVSVKGEHWKVTARDGDEITMVSRLGARTGTPDPDADVQVVDQPKTDPWEDDAPSQPPEALARIDRAVRAAAPKTIDPELRRLRDFARSEGFRASEIESLDLTDLRNLIHRRRLEKVAKDNEVPTSAVEDIQIRLTLGATVVAELHTSKAPSTPKVEKMDAQTMRNHLSFFHDTYPDVTDMDRLVELHERAADHERHLHDLEF